MPGLILDGDKWWRWCWFISLYQHVSTNVCNLNQLCQLIQRLGTTLHYFWYSAISKVVYLVIIITIIIMSFSSWFGSLLKSELKFKKNTFLSFISLVYIIKAISFGQRPFFIPINVNPALMICSELNLDFTYREERLKCPISQFSQTPGCHGSGV